MKPLQSFTTALFVLALLIPAAFAQRMYDSNGRALGRVDAQRFYSASGQQIGRVNSERLYDSSGRQIGRADGLRRMQMIVFFYFFI
jgi:hypothetical protein